MISDFRFQIEGCLVANLLFEQDKNIPFTSSVCFVLLGLVQSQIRNLQSAIQNRPPWLSRVSAPATYRSGTPRHQSRGTVTRWIARLAWASRLAMAGRNAHLRALATAIHEISGLGASNRLRLDLARTVQVSSLL